MCPRRRRRGRKAAVTVEAIAAKATSVTSFSKRPPLALSEAALFFFNQLPLRYCGDDPCVVGDEELQRYHALKNSIHDAYLQALARLPFHAPDGGPAMPSLVPALLAGGHCVGPLPDFASNIIVNTGWIHAASAPGCFAADAADVDVVVLDDVKWASIAALRRSSPPSSPTADDDKGECDYYAAAVAAKHPNPEAFEQFARSGVANSPNVMNLLGGTFRLSTTDVHRLSALLVAPSGSPIDHPRKKESKFKASLEEHKMMYQEWIRELFAMAMRHWIDVVKGPELQLHVVCATSVFYIGKYCYEHINFMATTKGNPEAIQLYFVEYADHLGVVLCCPVQDSITQSGHCSGCQGRRERIIHPSFGGYSSRTPFDATCLIIDSDVANLLNIEYARGLKNLEDEATIPTGYSSDGNSSTEWDYMMVL